MLLTLLVWTYITILSLTWGNIFLLAGKRLQKNSSVENTDPIVICFAGLATIGIIALYLSLFIPLGPTAHICLLSPAIAFFFLPHNRTLVLHQLQRIITGYSTAAALLLITGICMTLIISSYTIKHPDTLAYHAQAIKWLETYKAVPGLVNIDYEVAMSNLWFAALAIFRFNFIYNNQFLFLNSCVLYWFLLFITKQISSKSQKKSAHFLWLLLLVYTYFSWTQFRLTATSASPDFIVTIYIWAAIYLYLQNKLSANNISNLLIVLFCCAAITIKLSSIVISLLIVTVLIQQLLRRKIAYSFGIAFLVIICMFPYIMHNIISSGYPLFPSAAGDMFAVDWKLPISELRDFQHYISAYARIPVDTSAEATLVLQKPFSQWIPLWFQHISLSDQMLLLLITLLFLFSIFILPGIIKLLNTSDRITLFICITGCIVWFITAPDPRFGTGYLVATCYLLYSAIATRLDLLSRLVNDRLFISGIIITVIGVSTYSVFRYINYRVPQQLIIPAGISQVPYNTFTCQGVTMHQTLNPEQCGLSPVPCIKDSCNTFQLRGSCVEEGFRATGTKH